MNKEKGFYRMVLALVIPIALQNLINVGVQTADVVMLGKVNQNVLAASSLAGQISFILDLFFFGITSGALVLTSQYWGKNDKTTIAKIMGIAMRVSILAAITFTVIAQIFPYQLMRIFSSEDIIIKEGIDYLRIVSFSYIFTAVTLIYLNVMRSVERVVVSTVIYLISLITNVILNSILIFGLFGVPKLGIQGAAIATLCARILEFVMVLIYDKLFNNVIEFKIKYIFAKNRILFADFLRYSAPVVMNELAWGAGCAAVTAIMGQMSSNVVAANSIVQVTRRLSTVVSFGIASATAIILGKTIGENKLKKAKQYSRKFIKISLMAGLMASAVVLIVRPIAMNVMNLEVEAREYLSFMMLVMAYFVIAQAFNTEMIVGIFRSGGDTKYGLMVDVTTLWCGAIVLGYIAAFVLKLSVPIVYMILLCDEILKIPFCIYRYRSGKWLKNVTRQVGE